MAVKSDGYTFSQRDFDKLAALAKLEGEQSLMINRHRDAREAMAREERALQEAIYSIEDTLSQKGQSWYEEHDASDLFVVKR